jgi:two-component system response regulator CpxR
MNQPAENVLIIDDDAELGEMLDRYLVREGFTVLAAPDGLTGIGTLRESGAAIVVLDVTMPGIDGFETLRRIRAFSAVPVLMLTARGDDIDRIVGLELGADDYLPKPFNPRELAARLRAILRRNRAPAADEASDSRRLLVGDVALDTGSRRVTRAGHVLELTATELAIATTLLRAAGEVVSRDRLSQEALGRRASPLDRSLDTHVANLRRKLGPGNDGTPLIRTVRGRGYQYVLPP